MSSLGYDLGERDGMSCIRSCETASQYYSQLAIVPFGVPNQDQSQIFEVEIQAKYTYDL